jgi:hypothetical protein
MTLPLSGNVVTPLYSPCIWQHLAPGGSSIPSLGAFYDIIAGIKNVNVVQTLQSYRIPPLKSVVDPYSYGFDPAFQVNPDPSDTDPYDFFLRLMLGYFMEGNSVTLRLWTWNNIVI